MAATLAEHLTLAKDGSVNDAAARGRVAPTKTSDPFLLAETN
jgi:hypothetical protein